MMVCLTSPPSRPLKRYINEGKILAEFASVMQYAMLNAV